MKFFVILKIFKKFSLKSFTNSPCNWVLAELTQRNQILFPIYAAFYELLKKFEAPEVRYLLVFLKFLTILSKFLFYGMFLSVSQLFQLVLLIDILSRRI